MGPCPCPGHALDLAGYFSLHSLEWLLNFLTLNCCFSLVTLVLALFLSQAVESLALGFRGTWTLLFHFVFR